jgi:glycosyltransferase involved in cell wall biosynthesis
VFRLLGTDPGGLISMQLGMICEPISNAQYRAVFPMRAMERVGHRVVWPDDRGKAGLDRLPECDLLHIYRRCDAETMRVATALAERGTAVVYDNDDDFTATPKESPWYQTTGGLAGRRAFQRMVKLARLSRFMTTTTETLAEKYRRMDVDRVEVIGNYLGADGKRRRERHDGVVIGWIAGLEHRADVARLKIAAALQRLMARHESVHVECIGVNLGLKGPRYRHDGLVHFRDLPARMARFDIGIAPLADIPYNHSRSDIKLKEYAASSVPWLASPIGPYKDLGENEGGLLVADDQWFDALDGLVRNARQRRRLARKGKKWAKRHTMDAVASRWEGLFLEAVGG